jgi:hypothetical protein
MVKPDRRTTHKQTASERALIYQYVTARDVSCRALIMEPSLSFTESLCSGKLERHHAGNTIGSKRITDALHCVLLCRYHHATWAPSHSRLILEWLADVEDARERARHDVEEDQR